MKLEESFPGVYRINGKLATLNGAPGNSVYGESRVTLQGKEYRYWEPSRSKLGAALARGLKTMPIGPGTNVLYLGAANGTTSSHVSDIVEAKGEVFCVEFSARAMRDLLFVCEKRANMVPILADARKPEEYAEIGTVDVIFEDVADQQQAEIMVNNSQLLKNGGFGMIAIKARCVDSSAQPEKIYAEIKEKLKDAFEIIEELNLAPFEADHLFLVLRKK